MSDEEKKTGFRTGSRKHASEELLKRILSPSCVPFMTIRNHAEKALKGDEISEPKIYTCNCKTPLYQAAPAMRDVLQHYLDLLEQANRGDEIAECKLFEDMVLIEQVLKKARGEA